MFNSACRFLVNGRALGVVLTVLTSLWGVALLGAPASAAHPRHHVTDAGLSQSACRLAAPYKHVIYIQYDNTHLMRDNPNVPSDLEQVPALKDFLTGNGTLSSNEHTPLISHTAGDIVTSLTGLYPDRNGIGVSNSYLQYKPGTGQIQTTATGGFFGPSAFTYWTDPVSSSSAVSPTDTLPNLIGDGQANTPAPWVAYTRAGCDVGAFSLADMELENTGPDIASAFGNPSSQLTYTSASGAGAPSSALKQADFEGIAIHCSVADSASGSGHQGLCSPSNGGVTDKLPAQPDGPYTGFNALFGAIYANQITSSPGKFTASKQSPAGQANGNINDLAAPVSDVYGYSSPGCQFCANGKNLGYNGQPISSQTIVDNPTSAHPNSGFPSGFSPTPAQTLGYVASMQEAGVPVTFAYIRDAHDNWSNTGPGAFGPGEAGYVDQLRQENQAYKAFFERLAADGINKSNTLFVFTSDEGDHFAGGTPSSACDGVSTPCVYNHNNAAPSANSVGEQQVNINDALSRELGDNNPFDIHFDDAANFYVHGAADSTAPPGPYDTSVRQLEQDLGKLTLQDQILGRSVPATQHIADAEDQNILHITTTDPLRTPTFTDFGNPAFFFQTFSCPPTTSPGCPTVSDGHAWNHGGDQPEVTRTWLGLVGPTVRNLGETDRVWSDHTDIRPTMLSLLGLRSSYLQDGRALTEFVRPSALPEGVRGDRWAYQGLAAVYKQLNAAVGQFGRASEIVSTTGSEGSSDSAAQAFDQQLAACQAQRDPLAARMKALLSGAVFGHASISPRAAFWLSQRGLQLIWQMDELSRYSMPPTFTVCSSSSWKGHIRR